MKQTPIVLPVTAEAHFDQTKRIERLERQLARERAARLEAEAIAERGLRDLYDSQRWLTLLQRITDAANRADDGRMSLDMAVGEICEHMGWDFGNAYLLCETSGDLLACGCWFAAQPDHLFPFVEASRAARFAAGEGLPGRVLRDGTAHWIDDVRRDSGFIRRAVAEQCGLASGCAFPVRQGDETVAVIEFFSRKTIVDHERLVAVVAQIGTQLGRVFERERARQSLLHDALHDSLTGLANRAMLAARSRTGFNALPATRRGLAMLVIDLDGFKAVNDRFGHQRGDSLLIEVASRLKACFGGECSGELRSAIGYATLARTGGDEFVVLVTGYRDEAALDMLADDIHAALRPGFGIGGEQVTIGCSIGIATSDDGHSDSEQVQRDADLAMYAAKAAGRGTTVRFTDELGRAVRQRSELERELRAAVSEHQFVLHYQPIVAIENGAADVRGFEALIRWNHPGRGLLAPAHFIDAAEESGLIVFMGDWVLEAACQAMQRLHAKLPRDRRPFVSINIAPLQFLQPHFARRVREVLMKTGIDPSLVRLEVTEGVAIMDAARTRDVLGEIRQWGVRTSLDDFGTGYSSLSYLQRLPFDTLKIDRSFVAAMDEGRSRKIIETILMLAKAMNMSVIAEGIESADQQSALEAMGCSLAQGYLYGKPKDEALAFAELEEIYAGALQRTG